MMQEAIAKVVGCSDLSSDEARAVMAEMIGGRATPSQVASFVTAMRMKGESEDELLGFVQAMRAMAPSIASPPSAVDLCGTGGDGRSTFNISTTASFVVAASGVPVAKHGNRSVSSMCGSADVLGALGVPVTLGPDQAARCLDSTGMCFMFAPVFHSSMRNVMGPRRELGLRTFFNLLGPMTNPAGVRNQLIGVYDFSVARKMASVMTRLGSSRVMVVSGEGTDEITTAGPTSVVESVGGDVKEYDLSPEMFGIERSAPESIRGGDASMNARTLLSILKGERSPRSDTVALNAGAALYVAGRTASIEEGLSLAREVLGDGHALAKLKEFARAARALEAERQMSADAQDLALGSLMPSVLVERSADISSHLRSRIVEAGFAPGMDVLDEELVAHPNVLTTIVLQRMIAVSRKPVPSALQARRAGRRFSDAIRGCEGVGVIAEYKPHSPSAPPLWVPPSVDEALRVYPGSGAVAISVLAEPDFFGGGDELFSRFRQGTDLPLLYKDFVVDTGQIRAAASLGADAVLLIAKVLGADALDRFISLCSSTGIEPFVELHDAVDIAKLEACASADTVKVVGLNSRDLRTMSTDLSRLESLRDALPHDKLVVAESGLKRPEDVRFVSGFDGVLVGSVLMTADDLRSELTNIVSACRRCPK